MSKKKKSISDKMKMLKTGLRALENSRKHYIESRDLSYLLTIQSQLRGLVAMGGAKMHPLLLNLADELSIELYIYAFVGSKSKNRSSSTVIGKTWTTKPEKGLKKFTLKDWLLVDDYFADGSKQFKDRNQIIKDTSNHEGGTHYIDEIPHIVETLKEGNVGGIDSLTSTLLDITDVVIYCGRMLILEYEFKLNIPVVVLSENGRGVKKLEYELNKQILQEKYKEMGRFSFILEGFK